MRFTNQEQQLIPNAAPIGRLRRVVAELEARYPDVRIGVTGMPILEFDEMQSSQRDMTVASILSLVGVVVLLVLGYGSFRYALLAVVVLLFGMAWTFGFVTLVIGHLNLLSVSFAVILIGLGIDFGIHYLARFCRLRSEGQPSAAGAPRDHALDWAGSGDGRRDHGLRILRGGTHRVHRAWPNWESSRAAAS